MYRSIKSNVPECYYTIPFGKARFHKKGDDLTIVTYGMGVHWALELLEKHSEIQADLIDLRTLVPWDREAVLASVSKTGKVLILHEDVEIGGFGGEISATISEHCFLDLDAPIMRVSSLNTAVPFDANLENQFLPTQELEQKLLKLWKY